MKQEYYNKTQLIKAMGGALERDIKKGIISYLRMKGYLVIPIRNIGIKKPDGSYIKAMRKGIADIFGLTHEGKFFAIEVKRKGGTIRPEQKIFIQEVCNYSGIGIFAYSVDDVRKAGL